jgi:aminoglycoside/choline kinase family phosphotransferase
MLDAESILAKTCAAIPEGGAFPTIEPITKGGSDRAYWRLRGDGLSLICMEYTTARPDNAAFVPVTRFLASLEVPVPEILALREDERLVWLEDLGVDDLWAHREAPWPERRALYESTLAAVVRLHRIGEARLAELAAPELQPPFDSALYRWEQDYFFDNFIAGSLGRAGDAERLREADAFSALIADLVALPRALVHRDFQSQNVIIREGAAWLIDYQGLRLGRPEYDVASLLYDPYVVLAEEEREHLKRFYFELLAPTGDYPDWERIYHRCAAQRLMQALGAYSFLGLKKGKPGFLAHIPNALANLRDVLERSGLLPDLKEKLGEG